MASNPEPPGEIYLLIWTDPYYVMTSTGPADWGDRVEPPRYWVRYELTEFGDVHTQDIIISPDDDPLDSEDGGEDDGGDGQSDGDDDNDPSGLE